MQQYGDYSKYTQGSSEGSSSAQHGASEIALSAESNNQSSEHGDYSTYMKPYGDYSKYMQGSSGSGTTQSSGQSGGQGDYSKYMQQYGDFSKYMQGTSGGSSAEQQGASEIALSERGNGQSGGQGDYSKYMQQYGDYSKYMQGSSASGSPGSTGDYSKYMSQYSGSSGASGASAQNGGVAASAADSNETSGAQQSGFQRYMAKYLPPGDGGYTDKWTSSWSNKTSSFEESHSQGNNGYDAYVDRYSSMAGAHPSSPGGDKSAEQAAAFQAAVGDSIGKGNLTGALNSTAESELAEVQPSRYSVWGLLTVAVAGMSLPAAFAFAHSARKARRVANDEAVRSLLAGHMV
jgi:hypothetical protein